MNWLGSLFKDVGGYPTSDVMGSPTQGIRSPWATTNLQPVILADIFGTADLVPVTRAEAMSIPAIKKGRNLITGNIARLPLKAYQGADELADQPTWLYRTNGQTPPQHRMRWTLDDLIFSGWALWVVERGAVGQIIDAVRIPPHSWAFDKVGNVLINNQQVPSDSVILFSGPDEGLLANGSRTIRTAADIERTAAIRASNPIPMMALKQTNEDQLDPSEVTSVVNDWVVARQSKTGAVGFLPYGLDIQELGAGGADFMIQARNQIAIDIANLLCLPASILNGTTATASLTYTTQEGSRGELVDFALSMWTDCITARLSMDDCVPRGTRVGFDLSFLTTTPPPTGGVPVQD